jgi:hypothetical protein|tara:strand:- start:1455 stop:1667 length:213 start_codon:yes stop_codon:yes gene_type:complete
MEVMPMIRRGLKGSVLALAVIAMALATRLWMIDFFAADACQDRGGSYHYDVGECSLTRNYAGDVPSLWPF